MRRDDMQAPRVESGQLGQYGDAARVLLDGEDGLGTGGEQAARLHPPSTRPHLDHPAAGEIAGGAGDARSGSVEEDV